ncbi:MAG: CRTAC1 family protein [Planctomycetota bacterium]|nr:CRTAC1 family protein [Planctomycetota bacterium]
MSRIRALRSAAACAVCSSLALGQGFTDLTARAGVTGLQNTTTAYGTGFACVDVDGDGDVDLVMPDAGGLTVRLFRNQGNLQFTDDTAVSGLGIAGAPAAIGAFDFDNDGDQDVLVGNWRTPLQLYVNDGTGRFVDQAPALGINSSSSVFSLSFGDYDRDGFTDVYVGNRQTASTSLGEVNYLFRNLGGTGFVEVGTAAGVDHLGLTLVAPFIDYDEDGWPDLYIANDKGNNGVPNTMFRNLGDGTFADIGAQINCNQAIDGMGVDFLDVFCDGGVDIFCTDSPSDHLFLQWDPNAQVYVDDTYTYGLSGISLGWSTHWFDYDNDGWQDLHVVHYAAPNQLFRHPGTSAPGPWTDVSFPLGISSFYGQYAAVPVDLDEDGGVDLVERFNFDRFLGNPQPVQVYRNNVSRGHWLKVRTEGTVSNRDGFGARVTVRTSSHVQRQWVRSGIGYKTGNDRRLQFGLGAATTVDEILVRWPSGTEQHLTGVAVDQVVDIVEPRFDLVGVPQVGTTAGLRLASPNDAGLPYLMFLSASPAGTTPLPNGLTLPIQVDSLTVYALGVGNLLLPTPLGTIPANGTAATSALTIPNLPFLSGITLRATAIVLDPAGYPGVRNVFPDAVTITIQ